MDGMQLIETIEVGQLNLPMSLYDELCDYYEVTNDSYKRYYPHNNDYPFDTDTLNEKLIEMGACWDDGRYYYVLLEFSW